MSALTELRERVLAATGPDREIDGDFAILAGWTFVKMKGDRNPYWRKPGVTEWYMRSDLPNFTASIDAALALVERMLPGCGLFFLRGEDEAGNTAGLYQKGCGSHAAPEHQFEETADTPPIAILAALLSALIAKEETT